MKLCNRNSKLFPIIFRIIFIMTINWNLNLSFIFHGNMLPTLGFFFIDFMSQQCILTELSRVSCKNKNLENNSRPLIRLAAASFLSVQNNFKLKSLAWWLLTNEIIQQSNINKISNFVADWLGNSTTSLKFCMPQNIMVPKYGIAVHRVILLSENL